MVPTSVVVPVSPPRGLRRCGTFREDLVGSGPYGNDLVLRLPSSPGSQW